MSLVDFSTRRPVTVVVFALAAVVFGLVAFDDLAVDLLPEISYPSLTVRTEYEGAAPSEIESLITRPVENAVGVVPGVNSVTSSSRADVSEVILEFGWGTNMDVAALDVRERLDLVQLPDDAMRPVLLRYDPSLDPVMRIGLTGDEELVRLRLIAERDVKRQLERVEGVAAALVGGGLEEEIQIEIDERRVASLGLTLAQIEQRLAQENVNLTGGRLQQGQTEYLVRTINEFERTSDLDQIVVTGEGATAVRLNEVARIVRGFKEREIITRIDGRESVEVAIYKEGGTNTVTVVDRVDERLAAVRKRLADTGRNLELTVISDQARYIRQSVSDVLGSALIGGTLAVLILLLFLRNVRATAIIAVSIPVSVVAAFFLMYVSGISLNIMSLGGLTLGIGLLVDNSIVVLESIQRRRDQGMELVEAARVGAGEVSQAVTASTMTTVCVFVPIVFVEGVAGQLFGDQALTVTYSLAVSLIVALTLIPMLASRRFSPQEEDVGSPGVLSRAAFPVALVVARAFKAVWGGLGRGLGFLAGPPFRAFDRGYTWLAGAYPRALDRVLAHRALTLGITGALFLVSLALIPTLGSELVPELVQGELFVDAELQPGNQLLATDYRLLELQERARRLDGVALTYSVAGTSREQGGIAGELRENVGQVTLRLDPPISREREEAVMDTLRPALDAQEDLAYRFGRPSYLSFKTPIEVEIRGYNLSLLERLAADAVERMRRIPGLADVRSSTEGGRPELQIRFNRERLASLGLTVAQVAGVVRAKVLGTVATDINREDRTIDIRVRAEEKFRDSARDLGNLNVAQSGTTSIPLSSVAEVVETMGPAEIRRAEGERVALITANLAKGRDLGGAADDIAVALAAIQMPIGYDARQGGQRQEMETSFQSLRFAILLAIFLVYLVMASQFESLLHPFVILFSVPFSLIGVVATLVVLSVPLSVVVLIGVVLLAGIVVNNAIILIDYTNRLRAGGMAKLEALREAGQARLRPILMTTATTVLGLLPLAVSGGEGSELRAPMALTVIGGLLVSTLLTLLIIPVVYSILDRSR
jgi:HAE1 family hydrophobic/amphiphilic exporter-1